jgi:sodium/bile acid cotransporter 7
LIAVVLALAFPVVGVKYVAPDITASWIAVIFIFIMSGLSLKSRELKKALYAWKFNIFVQIFSLGVVPSIVFGVSRLLAKWGALS